jgi:hypothetical protein
LGSTLFWGDRHSQLNMFSFFTGKPKASANPEPSAAARGAGGGHQGGGAPAAAYAAQPQRDSVEQQNAKKKFEAEKKAENDLISLKALALKLKAAPESDKMGESACLGARALNRILNNRLLRPSAAPHRPSVYSAPNEENRGATRKSFETS